MGPSPAGATSGKRSASAPIVAAKTPPSAAFHGSSSPENRSGQSVRNCWAARDRWVQKAMINTDTQDDAERGHDATAGRVGVIRRVLGARWGWAYLLSSPHPGSVRGVVS